MPCKRHSCVIVGVGLVIRLSRQRRLCRFAEATGRRVDEVQHSSQRYQAGNAIEYDVPPIDPSSLLYARPQRYSAAYDDGKEADQRFNIMAGFAARSSRLKLAAPKKPGDESARREKKLSPRRTNEDDWKKDDEGDTASYKNRRPHIILPTTGQWRYDTI